MGTVRLEDPFTIITDLPANANVITLIPPGADRPGNPCPYETWGQLKGKLIATAYSTDPDTAELAHDLMIERLMEIVDCIRRRAQIPLQAVAEWVDKGWILMGEEGEPVLAPEIAHMAATAMYLPATLRKWHEHEFPTGPVGEGVQMGSTAEEVPK